MTKKRGIIVGPMSTEAIVRKLFNGLTLKAFAEEKPGDEGGEGNEPTVTKPTINYEDLIAKARKEEKEISYHNLLVGILTGNADWLVKSNVEAGEGFADIIVETDDPDAGIVVELKYTKNFDDISMFPIIAVR